MSTKLNMGSWVWILQAVCILTLSAVHFNNSTFQLNIPNRVWAEPETICNQAPLHNGDTEQQENYSPIRLAKCYAVTGFEHYRQSAFPTSNNLLRYYIALGDKKAGKYSEAIRILENLIKAYPESQVLSREGSKLMMAAAFSSLNNSEIDKALAYLDQAQAYEETDEWMFFRVAEEFGKHNRADLAREYYQKSSHFHSLDRTDDYLQQILPVLLNQGVVTNDYIQRLASFLAWNGNMAGAKQALSLAKGQTGGNYDLAEAEIDQRSKIQDAGGTSPVAERAEVENIGMSAELLSIDSARIQLGKNLVENGDFESISSAGGIADWTWAAGIGGPFDRANFVGGVDTWRPGSGNQSLLISGLWREEAEGKFPPQAGYYSGFLELQPSSLYLLTFRYRTAYIDSGTASLLFDVFEGSRIGDYLVLPDTNGLWKRAAILGQTSENCCEQARLFLASFATGNVWYDQVALQPVILSGAEVKVETSLVAIK